MSVADWTLLVATGTLLAGCAVIVVTVVLNRRDRETSEATLRAVEEAKSAALATKEAIEAAQIDLAESRKLSEEVRDLEVAQRRAQRSAGT